MSRLNKGTKLVTAPLQTESAPSGKTHEGAPGFLRDPRTELFMRAACNFAGEGTFYEKGDAADKRAVELARLLASEEKGWAWLRGFLPWLRSQANIRTSSVLLAAEAARERFRDHPQDGSIAELVDAVQLRADEPGEMLQYCLTAFGGFPRKAVKKDGRTVIYDPVKQGTALAAARLYTERAALRWDKPERPMRFADVISITHPKVAFPKDMEVTAEQVRRLRNTAPDLMEGVADWEVEVLVRDAWKDDRNALFRRILEKRHHPDGEVTPDPPMFAARRRLSKLSPAERHALAGRALDARRGPEDNEIFRAAAGQWEWTHSWLGEGVKDLEAPLSERQRWELVVPWMGYMALLRNLRNLDQAGVRQETVTWACRKLADPGEVAMSRQLPFRFLSAYLNVPSVKWSQALEEALQACIHNVPVLGGSTLILIDTSGSMQQPLSQRPSRPGETEPVIPNRVHAAALFGLALAIRNPENVDVHGFADGNFQHGNLKGASLLHAADKFCQQVGSVGHGTKIEQNVRQLFDSQRHSRVAIFTDMQAFPSGYYNAYGTGDVTSAVPESIPVYAWNLAGHSFGAMATKANRVELAGLTDASFGLMKRYEQGLKGAWPWELKEETRRVDSDGEEE